MAAAGRHGRGGVPSAQQRVARPPGMASGSPPPAPCSARPDSGAPAGGRSELLEAARSLDREAEGLEAQACAARGRAQSLTEQAAAHDALHVRRPRACRPGRSLSPSRPLRTTVVGGGRAHVAALHMLPSVSGEGGATCGCLLPSIAETDELDEDLRLSPCVCSPSAASASARPSLGGPLAGPGTEGGARPADRVWAG